MQQQKSQPVFKVVITFRDRSKIEFYGTVVRTVWKGGVLTSFSWRNVSFVDGPTVSMRRLTYVDLSQIRAIEEHYFGGKSVLDGITWVCE